MNKFKKKEISNFEDFFNLKFCYYNLYTRLRNRVPNMKLEYLQSFQVLVSSIGIHTHTRNLILEIFIVLMYVHDRLVHLTLINK